MRGAFRGTNRMALEFGSWAPVCGGWLRTLDAQKKPTPANLVRLARHVERLGYDFYYVPEHYLNAIHGPREALLDAWVVSSACVAGTRRIRVITAVQPGFKAPGVVAKMGATLSQFRPGAFGLSLLAGWWQLEVENYADVWLPHAERYARAAEFLDVVRGFWTAPTFDYEGKYYSARNAVLEPKPDPVPPVIVAGESERAIELAARAGDYLFINGGDPEQVRALVRRAKTLAVEGYGRSIKVALSAFGVVRESNDAARAVIDDFRERADRETIGYFRQHMDGAVVAHNRGSDADTLEANLGLHSGLIGDAPTILQRLVELEQAGVDAIMVKCEPAFDESERFARQVIAPYRAARALAGEASVRPPETRAAEISEHA
jgi:FMNH2-dependent dimethyl sulfone monooxygenase